MIKLKIKLSQKKKMNLKITIKSNKINKLKLKI